MPLKSNLQMLLASGFTKRQESTKTSDPRALPVRAILQMSLVNRVVKLVLKDQQKVLQKMWPRIQQEAI